MRKCRAASNRSAVRVARDAGGPQAAVRMFGRLKRHFFSTSGGEAGVAPPGLLLR